MKKPFRPIEPKVGEPVKAAAMGAVIRKAWQKIRGGPGIIVKDLGDTVTISLAQRGGGRGSKTRHPWQASANGDDTVTVSPGKVLSLKDGAASSLASLTMADFGTYAGGSVTVTANGFIYGSIPAALSMEPIVNFNVSSAGETGDVNITLMRIFPDINESITVAFGTSLPISINTFYWEICTVSLVDGVASVDEQVLTHNPILWSFVEPA